MNPAVLSELLGSTKYTRAIENQFAEWNLRNHSLIFGQAEESYVDDLLKWDFTLRLRIAECCKAV